MNGNRKALATKGTGKSFFALLGLSARAPVNLCLCCLAALLSATALMARETFPVVGPLPAPVRQAGGLIEASDYSAAAALLQGYLPKASGRDAEAARLALSSALLEADDSSGAIEALSAPWPASSPFAPYARYLRAKALGAAQRPAEGMRELKPLMAGRAAGSLRKAAITLFAVMAEQSGDFGASAKAWGRLEELSKDESSKAPLRFREAQALLSGGQMGRAAAILKNLYLKDLTTPYGHQAGLVLARNFPKARVFPSEPRPALALAESFIVHGRALDGWDILQSLEAKKLSAKEGEKAEVLKAGALYALRWNDALYEQADALTKTTGAKPALCDVALHALWACLRTDDSARARAYEGWLQKELPKDDTRRGDALYALGSFDFTHGDFASARASLSLLDSVPAAGAARSAALYKLAWASLKLGDKAGALDQMRRVALTATPSYASPAKFMEASLLAESGSKEAAARAWTELSMERGYWAVQAREALAAMGLAAPASVVAPPPAAAPAQAGAAEPYLAEALRAASMGEFSADAYEPYFRIHSGEPAARLQYATYLSLGASPGKGAAMVSSVFGDVEGADEVDASVAAAAYPTPWRSQAEKGPAPAALVYAIARRESGFDARCLSPAGALGLMQLMPETIAKLALQGETLPTLDDILDPKTNLGLGSLYLAKLKERFPTTAAAVAAYNAGEDRVELWLKSFSPASEREFVAMIPYEETRLYTERVLLDYRRYQQLLAAQPQPRE